MGRVGSALDNAAAEAFNSIIKVEYIHRQRFRTRAEARLKIAQWIVDFYNTRRRHSACDASDVTADVTDVTAGSSSDNFLYVFTCATRRGFPVGGADLQCLGHRSGSVKLAAA
jgi:hypothetical protein